MEIRHGLMEVQEPPNLRIHVLIYVANALRPPEAVEVATNLKAFLPNTKEAIAFWLRQGMIKEIGGKLYATGQLN